MFTSSKQRRPRVNRRQKLSEKKVVDKLDMEDLDKLLKKNDGKVCYCRCWKSAKVCMSTRIHVFRCSGTSLIWTLLDAFVILEGLSRSVYSKFLLYENVLFLSHTIVPIL